MHLIEGRRAHNICIELSGTHLDVRDIKHALATMDFGAIATDALDVLQRAVPTAREKADIRSYLDGSHPKFRGLSDPARLAPCERCAAAAARRSPVCRLGPRMRRRLHNQLRRRRAGTSCT